MISFPCPKCGVILKAPEGTEGRQAKCKCGESVQVPVPLALAVDAANETVQRWEYVVDDVYDDFSTIPEHVPPGRLMNESDFEAWLDLFNGKRGVKASKWTMAKFLNFRGAEGWEFIQATRMPGDKGVDEPGPDYWKVFFKRPRN